MDELKKVGLAFFKIVVFLSVGLLFTVYVLKPVYENSGIPFTGNVWVNWFGVAYIFFGLYTVILGVYKESILFKKRLTSVPFWLVYIASSYVVFIPFVKGEIPF